MITGNIAMYALASQAALFFAPSISTVFLVLAASARRHSQTVRRAFAYSMNALLLLRCYGAEKLTRQCDHYLIRLAVFFLVAVASLPASMLAQIPDPINAAQAPIPGAGHHYVGTGGETLNPADGNPSFDLPIQLPPGRGISMPFGIHYSSPEHRYITNGILGAQQNEPLFWTQWEFHQGEKLQMNGWSYQLPWMTLNTVKVAQAKNSHTGYTTVCLGTGNYMFHGFDFVEQSLALRHIYQDPLNNHNTFTLCSDSMNSVSDRHGVRATTPDLAIWNQRDIPAISPPVTVIDQSGTTYQFAGGSDVRGVGEDNQPPVNFGQLAQSITDRNGNQLTRASNGYTDALGRRVLSWSGLGNDGDIITVPGLGANIVLHWTNVNASNGAGVGGNVPPGVLGGNTPGQFIGCGGSSGGATNSEVSEIDFPGVPDVQKYTFSYEPTYGRLSRISFPGGGYIRYQWGLNFSSGVTEQHWTVSEHPDTNPGGCRLIYDAPAVTDRYVSYDGSTEALHQHFAYSTTWSEPYRAYWTSKQTTVTSTDLIANQASVTIYNYIPLQADPGSLNQVWMGNQVPVEQSVVYQDGSGNTLKSVNKT